MRPSEPRVLGPLDLDVNRKRNMKKAIQIILVINVLFLIRLIVVAPVLGGPDPDIAYARIIKTIEEMKHNGNLSNGKLLQADISQLYSGALTTKSLENRVQVPLWFLSFFNMVSYAFLLLIISKSTPDKVNQNIERTS